MAFNTKRFFNKNIVKITLVFLLAIAFLFGAAACDGAGVGKIEISEALDGWTAIDNKSSDLTMDIGLSAYNATGEAIKIGQQLALSRTQADGRLFVSGSLKTSEFTNFPVLLLNMIRTNFAEAAAYLTTDMQLMFEAGMYNGTLNARGDYLQQNTTPDYKHTINEQEMDLFIGLKESDIQSFLTDTSEKESVALPEIVLMRELMMPAILPIGWNTDNDQANGQYNKGTKSYHHKYVMTDAELKDLILSTIDLVLDSAFEDKTDPDYVKMQGLIEKYKDTVLSWINFDDLVFTAQTDSKGRLIATTTDFGVTVKIPDADLIKIATENGIDESQVKLILGVLHSFIGSSNREQGITEARATVAVNETYKYGNVTVDTGHILFTPYDSPLEGRHLAVYDKEGERGPNWKIS